MREVRRKMMEALFVPRFVAGPPLISVTIGNTIMVLRRECSGHTN